MTVPKKAMEFGVRLPVAGPLATPAAIGFVAKKAEELNFHRVWVHDYIVWTKELDRTHVSCGAIEIVGDEPPKFFESITTLSFLSGLTTHIGLGIAVLVAPYRNPIIAAKQLATLDVLSDGRLLCGIGVGARRATHNREFEVLRIPRREKYQRTREAVRVMRTIWTDEKPSFDGAYTSFSEADFYPQPVQKPYPPIWFGGSGSKALELVAELGDGWLPAWLSPDDYRERIPILINALHERGRSRTDMKVGNEIVACIASSGQEARRLSEKTMATLTSGFTVTSPGEAMKSALVGSPGELRERVEEFAAAGVDHLELKFIYLDIQGLVEQLTLFREEVMDDWMRTPQSESRV